MYTPKIIRQLSNPRNTQNFRARLAHRLKQTDRRLWINEAFGELADMSQITAITTPAPAGHLEYAVSTQNYNVIGVRLPDGSIRETCHWNECEDLGEIGESHQPSAPSEDLADLPCISHAQPVSRELAGDLLSMGFQTVRISKSGMTHSARRVRSDYTRAMQAMDTLEAA